MTREESYIQEYPKINKAYNQMFDSLQVLIEAENSDPEICNGINSALVFMDQILDAMKEERDVALKEGKSAPQDDKPSKNGFKVF